MFEIDRKEFGAFLALLRKEKGMTQKELAERLYVSDKAVSKWETGVSIPDVSLLLPLSEELDVTVAELAVYCPGNSNIYCCCHGRISAFVLAVQPVLSQYLVRDRREGVDRFLCCSACGNALLCRKKI